MNVRAIASSVLHLVPEVRGLSRMAAFVHKFAGVGGEPLVIAQMRRGHRMRLDLRSHTEYLSYYTGAYDTAEIQSVSRLLRYRKGWTVLDVGANVGFWTIAIAAIQGNSECRLHAFEPVESNYKRLLENIHINGLQGVVCGHNFGLSDSETTAEIALREDFETGSQTGNASIVIDDSDRKFPRVAVPLRTLDGIRKNLGIDRLDFIKLDIEGHEDKFLAGAAATIAKFRPVMLVEINDPYYRRRGIDPTALFSDWLGMNDYQVAVRRGSLWVIAALEERKPVLDNVLLLPKAGADEVVRMMN